MRLKSRIDSIEKRIDQKHVQVWDETEYQRLSAVLQRGFDDLARDPASEAIYGAEFLEAATEGAGWPRRGLAEMGLIRLTPFWGHFLIATVIF